MFDPNIFSGQTQEVKRKGRKPKEGKVSINYFDTREEKAVVDFLTASTQEEKNFIYETYLKDPINKMISSIIGRYKLNRDGVAFSENHNDTHSFLITKLNHFDPQSGYKAYSYLIGQIDKDKKYLNKTVSYEDISSELENMTEFSYDIETETRDSKRIITMYLTELKVFMTEAEKNTKKLNENEMKIGYALCDLFENYESIFQGTKNNKFNKNIILLALRDMTNMKTNEIRASLKKFMSIYFKMIKKTLKH
jgi:hypothetical protein